TLNIGCSAFGLATFCPTFLVCRTRAAIGSALGIGRAVGGGRLGGILLGLGGVLVGLAAVVGFVEARTLEQDSGPGAKQAPQFRLLALGALLQVRLTHRLKFVEVMVAVVANVFVRGHRVGPLPIVAVARVPVAAVWRHSPLPFSVPITRGRPKPRRAPGAAHGRASDSPVLILVARYAEGRCRSAAA